MSLATPKISITGSWQGTYAYQSALTSGLPSVEFLLQLKPGFLGDLFGFFNGTVEELAPGMPGTGTIRGRLNGQRIQFIKSMPVCYVTTGTELGVSLSERLRSEGYKVKRDPPHPPIIYKGVFSDSDHATGKWTIAAGSFRVGLRAFRSLSHSGTWTLKRT